MSWFGDTFGDSLNSIKGQIQKITKEVLADDEASNSDRQDSKTDLVKELEALSESKDLEIASLRDEFNKLHEQYKSQIELLKPENISKGNKIVCDKNDSRVEELENKLTEVMKERDHLNSCLDELQSEHQTNLNQVISIRDKYKSELEVLKQNYDSVKANLDMILGEGLHQHENDEFSLLKTKINELQLQLQKEQEESVAGIRKEKENQIALKEQLQKLLQETEVIKNEKNEVKRDRNNILLENESIKNKLNDFEKEIEESDIKLKILLNEKEELLKKCQKLEHTESKLLEYKRNENEIRQKVENLLQVLQLDSEKIKDRNICELINLVENKVHEKFKELNEIWKESASNLKLEVTKLNEENRNFQNKLSISVEKNSEIERKYQEEISFLKNSLSDMKSQEQDCINQSQTDDVKRLEQEIAQCTNLLLVKNNEITDYSKSLNNLEQELKSLKISSKNTEDELLTVKEEKSNLEEEIINLKNFNSNLSTEKVATEDKIKKIELEKANLIDMNKELEDKTGKLEQQMVELMTGNEKVKMLQEELKKSAIYKSDLDKMLTGLQNENLNLKQDLENMKAQVIIKESNLEELMRANIFFQDEVNKLQTWNNELINSEKELKKWKDASIDLQIQQEDLIARRDELDVECLRLRSELETGLMAKNTEIEQLKLTNSNLIKSYNDLHQQLENKAQMEQFSVVKGSELEKKCQKQSELILQLQDENSELKTRVQKFQEQMKLGISQLESQSVPKEDVQQHRRSKSDVDGEVPIGFSSQNSPELKSLRQALQQEQAKCQLLQHQIQEISNKEASARKEFERLKQHLIEVEDHYTEETVENEKVINDLKSKLMSAEEQLHNSSTLYTSLKVRDNQHLESLQSQIRMITAQRDDFQAKLSAAEDEVQKHKASLMSLQIVLEQFQQDKETEIEKVIMKYEKQLQQSDNRFGDVENEIKGLKKQLAEAKNGLNAASRLGEQLEKKQQQVAKLEESHQEMSVRIAELEKSLTNANQANAEKIDKLLIKNLVAGYVLSPHADRKSQALKIMASVLDFDQDERNKMGVDATKGGWLSNILHPQGEGSTSSQSLSEAFIRFLENESRPQPQLKLLPEQVEAITPKTSRISPKPSGRLPELMLPTFNSSQENDSSIILKNVLKNS